MSYRPIGISHSAECDGPDNELAERDNLCDDCREEATHDWENEPW